MLSEQTAPNNLQAALELANLGWPVFPCVETPGEKAKSPYTRNGFHDASIEPTQIHTWWDYKPRALIGLAVPAGMMVIDIDPRKGGSREALEEKVGKLPITATVWSGRGDGGHHLYFMRPKGDLTGIRLRSMGIDLKDADRGYVIAPPSLHPDTGQPYWDEYGSHIAVCSENGRLHELLKPEPVVSRQFRTLSDTEDDFAQLLNSVANAEDGNRNNYLFWAACRLGEKGGLDSHEDALVEAALSTGLEDRAIRSTIHSARRRVGV